MEKIKGYIEHFVYKNEENGYGVATVISDGDEITCVGTFRDADVGDTLEIEGELVQHPMYGDQIKVSRYTIVEPEDAQAMERYLASGAIKGVGAALAARIIKKFGEDTFRIIEMEPERLAEIRGISERKAIEIATQMSEKREARDIMIFLQRYGISDTMAVKIYNTYGGSVYTVMQQNPYKLAEDIGGIGFKTADEIASRIGFSVDSDFRIRSGILYMLQEGAQEGNTYLPKNILIKRTSSLLRVDEDLILSQLDYLAIERRIIIRDEDKVYSSQLFGEERACAQRLYDLNIHLDVDENSGTRKAQLDRIRFIEKKKNIELDDLQREAILKSASNGILILTGGPGTGKTTTINTIISYFEEEGLDIQLAAPTGRAAKRMTEATGYEARTIHRLLEISGGVPEDNAVKQTARFNRDQDNPLEADVIIIDEMSMVDIHLFHALLKAVIPGMHLIFVGDSSQLPSVGPGQILHDLISCGKFATVVLNHIFRQAKESDIVMNAHYINQGQMPGLSNKSKDFFFLERNDYNIIYKHMIMLIRDKLPGYVDADPFDIQVLTPMKKGALGCETLNKILQQYLNPADPSKAEYMHGDRLLRVGDKVMQIHNNYQAEWEIIGKYNIPIDGGTGIFNGDMGRIVSITTATSSLVVEFDEKRRVTYSFSNLDELELAYAVTIHKSQGSEYPAIVIPLLGGPRMLTNRNLLYTAVTRARKCVMILGSKDAIREMVENEDQLSRYTGLKDQIEEIMSYDE
ncbi:exodeoxyribonuclease V alpha subunit [Butyrivibrio fibrisolvens DSM 3071]|uniref:ATP-dependent RecD2 DNA helicase n=1 Tax=Butyrivibrio fibrisolvens DSM 3071 TaxID=1121131 RepID=A0A1M5Z875_BUTFI|nr:ATP-dependent RecD-like DNA helicase [Butyrivibrio fibrisolvens]SHI20445.1 exodeoxyribonuclease V alpha subunit [Butyrivibrio fibrisolvens DSM 3071]